MGGSLSEATNVEPQKAQNRATKRHKQNNERMEKLEKKTTRGKEEDNARESVMTKRGALTEGDAFFVPFCVLVLCLFVMQQ
jgi:hypothetical protein